ncbi:MAG: DEAD/DEAH box helicase [Planctomycetes bacterium]|nr:DEAD/DEAH box helicase [Planctomycetota bacterium]
MAESIPELGQLVDVRQRRFVVIDIEASAIGPAATTSAIEAPQHLVRLSSIEDDALGEELSVVWEIEPGARALERMALPSPSGFDTPKRLDAFINAVRWGAIASANDKNLQAPFRSGIDIEDYQLDPVVRALEMPRVNLLIADDVGLGKTIESGLVAQELILRHRARRVLVVCPSSLQIQWRDQMRDKFGLEFRIVDSDCVRTLRRERGIHTNPWKHFPRLITSIDFLKRERPLRLFRETLPGEGEPAYPRRYDLLILDEAHNCAPSQSLHFAIDSDRTQAIRTIAPHFEHKLFLSATPHNGYKESFTALLELLDDQRFHRGVEPDRNQLGAVMVRRMKSDLQKMWDTRGRFAERRPPEAIEVDYTSEEKRAHQLLRDYSNQLIKLSGEGNSYAAQFILKLLKKRLFSCPEAFAITLGKHAAAMRRTSKTTKDQESARRAVDRHSALLEEEKADDDEYETTEGEAVESATEFVASIDKSASVLLSDLQKYAEAARRKPDSKAKALIEWLKANIKPGGRWGAERVIIFTEYRATQNWLLQILSAEELNEKDRLLTLYGGMDKDLREKVKAAFQAGPEQSNVRILLATDAASEGIDLQNHCSKLIHIEIPWNPSRMEQRNGRVDRHGQRAEFVNIYHFVGRGYKQRAKNPWATPGDLDGDLEFLLRAALKVNQIREDLGKVGPVIAAQVEDAMLGKRTRLDTDSAERAAEPARRMLKFERDVAKETQKARVRLEESQRSLHIDAASILNVVETGLSLAGQPALIPTTIPPRQKGDAPIPAFRLPRLTGSWANCSEGLAHPHSQQIRPIVFDHSVADGRDDVVLAHLNHRIVQMCLRLLRGEIWNTQDNKKIHRVCARVVPNNDLDMPSIVAHARFVVIGGDHERIHEEVITAGGRIREGRFVRMNQTDMDRALDSALDLEPHESVKKRFSALFANLRESLVQSIESRADDRVKSLQKSLDEKCNLEVKNMAAILRGLEKMLSDALDEKEADQREFNFMEEESYKRARESLRPRLAKIPNEIEAETSRIRSRFANPNSRVFPVSLTFLVPERFAAK